MDISILNTEGLSEAEKTEINKLAAYLSDPPTQDEIWRIMDKVWDELGCQDGLTDEKMAAFYRHPLWILNGLLIEKYDFLKKNYRGIADFLSTSEAVDTILDYGGGFGNLAAIIAEKCPEKTVHVYEPYPTNAAKSRLNSFSSADFVSNPKTSYDCVICLDVLEHVRKPLEVLCRAAFFLKDGGVMIIANSFNASIKCHLPENFHYRYSFDFFATAFGLDKEGPCAGTHASYYIKNSNKKPSFMKLVFLNVYSRLLYFYVKLRSNLAKNSG